MTRTLAARLVERLGGRERRLFRTAAETLLQARPLGPTTIRIELSDGKLVMSCTARCFTVELSSEAILKMRFGTDVSFIDFVHAVLAAERTIGAAA